MKNLHLANSKLHTIRKKGERKLQQFCSMVGYHHPSMNLNDDDSWLNIDDKEDERGRVGDLWPWQEKDGQ